MAAGDHAAALDGLSMLEQLAGNSPVSDRSLFWRSDLYDFGAHRAVRQNRFKYVEHGNTQFLFDLDADSGERNNLFARYPDVVNRMRESLDAWEANLPAN